MDKMKKYFTFLIILILFYLFSNFIAYEALKTSLVPIENYSIECESPQINIEDACSSKVNGYVKGTVKNNTDSIIENKYIKVNFISKAGNVILSKYAEISKLNPGDEQEFKINFNAENITSFSADVVDNKTTSNIDIDKTELREVLVAVFLTWVICQ